MKICHDITRHGRYMIHSTSTDGRVMRLSVTPEAARWYYQQHGDLWDRRIVQDFDRTGGLNADCLAALEEQHDSDGRHKPPLFIKRNA